MIEFPTKLRTRPERRGQGQRDVLLQLLTLCGVITALIVVTAMVLLSMAQPSSWSRINTFNTTGWWDKTLLRYFYYLMLLGFAMSSIGIFINMKRLKRKYDSVRVNLVFMWLFSVVGIVVYFFTL